MADDFTRIRGVSPRIATRLQEAGILTYEKLAAMTPDEVVMRIGPSSGIAERIARHDWIGQAIKLADKPNKRIQNPKEPDQGTNLHAMNYLIELFLDESNYVCRTKIHHIQSDKEEAWDGWDEAKLVTFFRRRSELSLTKPMQAKQDNAPSHFPQSAGIKTRPELEVSLPAKPIVKSETKAGGSQRLAGMPCLQKLEIVTAQSNSPCQSLDHNQAYNVRLHLDLGEMKPLGQESFNYYVTVLAKSLSASRRQAFVKHQGVITTIDRVTLNLKGPTLSPGIYRIAAALTLSPKDPKDPKDMDVTPQSDLNTSLEGSLFEVY